MFIYNVSLRIREDTKEKLAERTNTFYDRALVATGKGKDINQHLKRLQGALRKLGGKATRKIVEGSKNAMDAIMARRAQYKKNARR